MRALHHDLFAHCCERQMRALMGLPLMVFYSPIYMEPKPSPTRFLALWVVEVSENHVVDAHFALRVCNFVSLELETTCMVSVCWGGSAYALYSSCDTFMENVICAVWKSLGRVGLRNIHLVSRTGWKELLRHLWMSSQVGFHPFIQKFRSAC